MGDVVLGELLKDRDLTPDTTRRIDYFVVPVTPDQRGEALGIAQKLRARGHSVAYALREQGVGKQLKAAAKEGAVEALLVGPDELARGVVTSRKMSDGSERDLLLQELA
jgi:histidyl-tRNA synthetase